MRIELFKSILRTILNSQTNVAKIITVVKANSRHKQLISSVGPKIKIFAAHLIQIYFEAESRQQTDSKRSHFRFLRQNQFWYRLCTNVKVALASWTQVGHTIDFLWHHLNKIFLLNPCSLGLICLKLHG